MVQRFYLELHTRLILQPDHELLKGSNSGSFIFTCFLMPRSEYLLDEFITSSVDLNSHIRLTQASKLIHIDIFQ